MYALRIAVHHTYGLIAQFGRASALQAEGRGFDSHWVHQGIGLKPCMAAAPPETNGKTRGEAIIRRRT